MQQINELKVRRYESHAKFIDHGFYICYVYLNTDILLKYLFLIFAHLFEIFLCKLLLINCHQLSCNSCSCLTSTWQLRKLSCKLSLVDSYHLLCNSCSRLTSTWQLRKLSHRRSRRTHMQFLLPLIDFPIFIVTCWCNFYPNWPTSCATSNKATSTRKLKK